MQRRIRGQAPTRGAQAPPPPAPPWREHEPLHPPPVVIRERIRRRQEEAAAAELEEELAVRAQAAEAREQARPMPSRAPLLPRAPPAAGEDAVRFGETLLSRILADYDAIEPPSGGNLRVSPGLLVQDPPWALPMLGKEKPLAPRPTRAPLALDDRPRPTRAPLVGPSEAAAFGEIAVGPTRVLTPSVSFTAGEIRVSWG